MNKIWQCVGGLMMIYFGYGVMCHVSIWPVLEGTLSHLWLVLYGGERVGRAGSYIIRCFNHVLLPAYYLSVAGRDINTSIVVWAHL